MAYYFGVNTQASSTVAYCHYSDCVLCTLCLQHSWEDSRSVPTGIATNVMTKNQAAEKFQPSYSLNTIIIIICGLTLMDTDVLWHVHVPKYIF